MVEETALFRWPTIQFSKDWIRYGGKTYRYDGYQPEASLPPSLIGARIV
jgi:hypothetical protein